MRQWLVGIWTTARYCCVDPRYGGDPRYNAWYDAMRDAAEKSIAALFVSVDPDDQVRLAWIRAHEATVQFGNGHECCPVYCEAKDPRFRGWGEDAKEAVDSAMNDEGRLTQE